MAEKEMLHFWLSSSAGWLWHWSLRTNQWRRKSPWYRLMTQLPPEPPLWHPRSWAPNLLALVTTEGFCRVRRSASGIALTLQLSCRLRADLDKEWRWCAAVLHRNVQLQNEAIRWDTHWFRTFMRLGHSLLSLSFSFSNFCPFHSHWGDSTSLWTGPYLLSVFLLEQNKLLQLWSSDRHRLQHFSCGGQVTTESCSFQINMLPLSLLPQGRDIEGPHSHTSSLHYTCMWVCVCMCEDVSVRTSPLCLLDLSLFIDHESLSLSPHSEVLEQVDSRQVWQAEPPGRGTRTR